jgi:broad specificity phosphatase PhoE
MSQATRVCLIRHGQTAWNAATRVQGHLDIGLDATGQAQAERLGAALADEGLDAIYSSDLARAYGTALAVARRLGLAVQTDTRLRERAFGRFEGQTHADIAQRWPEAAARWRQRVMHKFKYFPDRFGAVAMTRVKAGILPHDGFEFRLRNFMDSHEYSFGDDDGSQFFIEPSFVF